MLGEHVKMVHKAKGCPLCNYTGYRGRMAIHEIIQIDKQVRKMIQNGASSEEIEEYAVANQGMRTLKECSLQLVQEGITTVEELRKIAYYS